MVYSPSRASSNKFSSFIKSRFDINRPILIYLVSVLVVFAIVYYFDDVMANVASSRSPDNTVVPILRDVGFEIIPQMNDISLMDDFDFILALIALIYALIFIPAPLYVISQVLNLNTMTNLLRITTVAITSFPDPRLGCDRITGNPFTTISLHRCGDDMFSGHSAIYAAATVMFFTYGYNVSHTRRQQQIHTIIKWLVLATAIAASLIILSNRTHYTVDVLVAWYITIGAWYVQLWWWEKVGRRKFKSLERLWWPNGKKMNATEGWAVISENDIMMRGGTSGEVMMQQMGGSGGGGSSDYPWIV